MGKNLDNFYDVLSLMCGLCFAVTSLTRLIRTKYLPKSPTDELHEAISQAIMEITQELVITERWAKHDNPSLGSSIQDVSPPALDYPLSEKAPPSGAGRLSWTCPLRQISSRVKGNIS